jgi:hypothetical protein
MTDPLTIANLARLGVCNERLSKVAALFLFWTLYRPILLLFNVFFGNLLTTDQRQAIFKCPAVSERFIGLWVEEMAENVWIMSAVCLRSAVSGISQHLVRGLRGCGIFFYKKCLTEKVRHSADDGIGFDKILPKQVRYFGT